MHPDIEQLFDKDHLFAINVGQGRPALAVAFRDILPILQNLTHLLSQNERKLIGMTLKLVDLEHTLGMAWQMPENSKQFSENLKLVIGPACPRHKDLLGNYDPINSKV